MRRAAPTTIERTLLNLRLIHAALLFSIVLYVRVMQLIRPNSEPMNPLLPLVLGFVAVLNIGFGQMMRSRNIPTALETLRVKPDDQASLAKWRTGALVSACLAESIVLFGMVLYLLGGRTWQVAPFLAGGALMMLLWWPKRP